jgi:hypothetical protein
LASRRSWDVSSGLVLLGVFEKPINIRVFHPGKPLILALNP